MKVFVITFIVCFYFNLFSQDTFIDSTNIKNPSIAWKLSFIPGLGQFYNGELIKTFFIHSALRISRDEIRIRKYSIAKRNTWAWWFFGIYALGIIDAYVDSHLTSFPVKKQNSQNQENSN